MIDERDLFERAASRFDPPTDAFERFTSRRERHRRNQRLVAGGVAVLVMLFVAGALAWAARTPVTPVPATPPGAFTDIHGWIAYGAGGSVRAADPSGMQPSVLVSRGADPIAWSANGQRLLLHDGSLLKADGTTAQLVPRHSGPVATVQWGSFSPDGRELVYSYYDRSLYVIDTDGSGRPRVLAAGDGDTFFSFPAWSPDGAQIAYFMHVNSTGTDTLSIMDADGTRRRVLVDLGGRVGEVGDLVWSPDGSRLAFSLSPSCCDEQQGMIDVVRADGTGLRALTGNDGSWGAAWSPDGTRVAYSRHGALFTAAADGSDERRVKDAEAIGYSIAWNPLAPGQEGS